MIPTSATFIIIIIMISSIGRSVFNRVETAIVSRMKTVHLFQIFEKGKVKH